MEAVLLVVGFLLGLIPGWIARGRRLRGHWGALRAELELCAEQGHALLSDHVGAPLYRFPTIAYEASLPVLLADGDVSEEESMALGRFYCQVQRSIGVWTMPQPLSRTHDVSNRNSSATFLNAGISLRGNGRCMSRPRRWSMRRSRRHGGSGLRELNLVKTYPLAGRNVVRGGRTLDVMDVLCVGYRFYHTRADGCRPNPACADPPSTPQRCTARIPVSRRAGPGQTTRVQFI